MVCVGGREVSGSRAHAGVSEGSVCNLQERCMQWAGRCALPKRPLIERDVEEHMLEKRGRGRGVRCRQRAGIWFLQVVLCKLEMTPGIGVATANR